MSEAKRKVCIVTGTRAEWGLLSPVARLLSQRPDVELQIVATNMHLLECYGHTIDLIRAEGFSVSAEVPMEAPSDSRADTARATARCLEGMAGAFERLRPDIIVILGDRYEMLAVASAATIMRIPIVHLHGGEVSEGAIDDSIRHAITKLSSLHLTSADLHSRRVIQMGEDPGTVFNIGAIGVENALALEPLPKEDLEKLLGIPLDRRSLVVTFHPATASEGSAASQFGALLDALDSFPESSVVFTYPNNDADGAVVIDMISSYTASRPGRTVARPSLGAVNYLSLLRYIGAAVGNSSSGIIEVPSMGIPTVNIGDRQKGRLASESVINCPADAPSIRQAIATALLPATRRKAADTPNPYSRPGSAARAAELIATFPLSRLANKRFHLIIP